MTKQMVNNGVSLQIGFLPISMQAIFPRATSVGPCQAKSLVSVPV